MRKAEQAQLDQYYQGWDDTWLRDLPTALVRAHSSNKRILVLITGAPWASDSVAFESTVLGDDFTIKKLASDFVLLKYVQTRDPSEMPDKLSAEIKTIKRDAPNDHGFFTNAAATKVLPLVIVVDPSGKYVTEIVGYNGDSPARFRSALAQQIDKAMNARGQQ